MYFRQYLHQTESLLRTDHKPLEWLAIVSDAYGRRGHWIAMLQDFQFKIIHHARSKHLNVDALSQNPIGFPKEDEDFGNDVLEQDHLRITPLLVRSNATNEANINLFTLQHTKQEINDAKEHHARSECGGQNTNSLSKEGLPPMNHMEYKRMVVEAQTIVDEIRNKQKGKSVETMGQGEDHQSRQMDIWEDNVSMVLLDGGHLETELYDTANIKRAKK
jgi:hypothetical protein